MAYDTENLKKQSLEAIEEHSLYFISDVIACLPCSKQTFYDHGLDKIDDIKKALDKNKIVAKIELRKKWLKSDNATMQMGIMKLLSEDEELKKLDYVANNVAYRSKSSIVQEAIQQWLKRQEE